METGNKLPKVDCKLAGCDGNAFAILGRFTAAARKAGWPEADVKRVRAEATSGDYNHLLATISGYCKNP